MRTNIVIDPALVRRAMEKSGARSMRDAVEIALRNYVEKPDYAGLLALAGQDLLDPDYDPKAGPMPGGVAERTGRYDVTSKTRRRKTRR
jgi:hypothetical protein